MPPPGSLVVVTGAGGFIGHALCAHLADAGWPVRGLVRALDATTAARAQFLPVGDLAAVGDAALAHALRGATSVVHLAARVHGGNDPARDSLAAMRRVNVDATRRLARAAIAAGVGHFVFASSVKVNGEATLAGRPFRESDPPDPHDDYAASKWEAEQALAVLAESSGLRATALRLPLTYGAGARANFAALARAVQGGIPLPLANIANRRSVLGIGNFNAAVTTLLAGDELAAPGSEKGRLSTYLLADAEPVSTPDLVRALAAALRVSPRLFALPAGGLRVLGACLGRGAAVERLLGSLEVDTQAFRDRFGWTPPLTLAAGLAAALQRPAPL